MTTCSSLLPLSLLDCCKHARGGSQQAECSDAEVCALHGHRGAKKVPHQVGSLLQNCASVSGILGD
jgi:hypothetical protein